LDRNRLALSWQAFSIPGIPDRFLRIGDWHFADHRFTEKKMSKYLDDIFYWLGALLIIVGAALLHPVAGLFSAGIFCLYFSYLIGKAKANQE
jgi:hypothetical protein